MCPTQPVYWGTLARTLTLKEWSVKAIDHSAVRKA